MSGLAYYNDNDSGACAWARQLIDAGLVMEGFVDERPIQEVQAADLQGYRRCHFFSGILGWDYALQLAGWPRDRPVWTASCPCPPFSCAGKEKTCPACEGDLIPCPRRTGFFICIECGHAALIDGRHLWPEVWRLIRDCRPAVVFGEQVSSGDGLIWLAGVRASLEMLGYAVGTGDIPAASEGSPHIRQRIYWCAQRLVQPDGSRWDAGRPSTEAARHGGSVVATSDTRRLADAERAERRPHGELHAEESGREQEATELRRGGVSRRLGDSANERHERERDARGRRPGFEDASPWSDSNLIPCRDGKWRRVPMRAESGVLPVADGLPADLGGMWVEGYGIHPLAKGVKGRVGLLRGAGNAIVPQVAAIFIRAFLEADR